MLRIRRANLKKVISASEIVGEIHYSSFRIFRRKLYQILDPRPYEICKDSAILVALVEVAIFPDLHLEKAVTRFVTFENRACRDKCFTDVLVDI